MDITAHVMVRNEENFIIPVMESIVQAGFAAVLVADCGSQDRTPILLAEHYDDYPNVHIRFYPRLTSQENGALRQHLTDMTHTPWCMMIDGDEMYWPWALRAIVASEMPASKRYGYTTLANVQRGGQGYYIASQHSKMAVFDRQTQWSGPYPFENPDDNLNSDLAYYFGEDIRPHHAWHGLHLHCLPRSSCDSATPWRNRIRQTQHERDGCLRRLRYLPVPGMLELVGVR